MSAVFALLTARTYTALPLHTRQAAPSAAPTEARARARAHDVEHRDVWATCRVVSCRVAESQSAQSTCSSSSHHSRPCFHDPWHPRLALTCTLSPSRPGTRPPASPALPGRVQSSPLHSSRCLTLTVHGYAAARLGRLQTTVFVASSTTLNHHLGYSKAFSNASHASPSLSPLVPLT
jgi:hypothetical protein